MLSVDLDKREVQLEVTIKNEADEVIAPGVAIVRFHEEIAG